MPDDFGGLGDLVDEGAPDEVLAQYLPTMYQSAAVLGGGGVRILLPIARDSQTLLSSSSTSQSFKF